MSLKEDIQKRRRKIYYLLSRNERLIAEYKESLEIFTYPCDIAVGWHKRNATSSHFINRGETERILNDLLDENKTLDEELKRLSTRKPSAKNSII